MNVSEEERYKERDDDDGEEEEDDDGDSASPRTLHIAGIGCRLGSTLEEVLVFLQSYGEIDLDEEGSIADHGDTPYSRDDDDDDDGALRHHYQQRWERGVLLIPGQAFILARFVNRAEALRAMESLSQATYRSHRLTVSPYKPPKRDKKISSKGSGPLCTSATASVQIPGLMVVEDAVTSQEEQDLLRAFDDGGVLSSWDQSLGRRVQHYGYIFDYKARKVDYTRQAPEIPLILLALVDRFTNLGLVPSPPDQITINEYLPGQGIAGHIETHSAFKDVLLSLSLDSGCVMDFRHPDNVGRKALQLKPRSLLVMQGEARYLWSHGIAYRKYDLVDGKVVARGRRISLTFRRVLPNQICFCNFISVCDTGTDTREAALDEYRRDKDKAEAVVPTSVEKDHVHAVYEEIAPHWNHTRAKRKVHWPRVKEFLEGLPPYSLIADVGCGDGKYLDLNEFKNPTCLALGCDRSRRLLELCRSAGRDLHQVFTCDVLKVPLRSRSFDAVLCVAVLHHLSTEAHRLQALREMARLLKIGGQAIVLVWALEQEHDSRRRFAEQDTLVPWKMNVKYMVSGGGIGGANIGSGDGERKAPEGVEDSGRLLVFNRYCHLYKEWELEGLLERLAPLYEFHIMKRGFDKGNWYVTLQKTKDRTI